MVVSVIVFGKVEKLYVIMLLSSFTILFRWAWLLVQSVATLILKEDACNEIGK